MTKQRPFPGGGGIGGSRSPGGGGIKNARPVEIVIGPARGVEGEIIIRAHENWH